LERDRHMGGGQDRGVVGQQLEEVLVVGGGAETCQKKVPRDGQASRVNRCQSAKRRSGSGQEGGEDEAQREELEGAGEEDEGRRHRVGVEHGGEEDAESGDQDETETHMGKSGATEAPPLRDGHDARGRRGHAKHRRRRGGG